MEKYYVSFRMQKSDKKIERVYSSINKTTKEWNDYFDKSCGGVYKWWRE